MKMYLRSVFIASLLLPAFSVFAQTSPATQAVLDNLYKQSVLSPSEKTYLQFDKPYYGAGDTVWFKAYLVIGAKHKLSALSNVLNVELINPDNIIIKDIKLPLKEGAGYGDFALPDTLTEGNYRVRAYTNWMRNAGSEYYFDQTFTIINVETNKVFTNTAYSFAGANGPQSVNAAITYTDLDGTPYAAKDVNYTIQLNSKKAFKGKGLTDDRGILQLSFDNDGLNKQATGEITTVINLSAQKKVTKIIPVTALSAKTDIQFFPESGSLVNGLTSKVAFKAVGADGLGIAVTGIITDEQNNRVAAFTSTHLGMGAFMLAPVAGKTYKATVTNPDGSKNTVDLPTALDKGFVLAFDGLTDTSAIKVNITSKGYGASAGNVTLVAQSGGEVYLQGRGVAGKESFSASILRNKLPTGLIQFTLFDDNGEPLNERLVFIQNPDQLNLTAATEKTVYAARQKVKINFEAKDFEDKPAVGTFSVSVIDESKVPTDECTENTILSNMLLSADINGYIEQPNYYFTNTSAKTAADLDVLMLTQGYHRFDWKQLKAGTMPVIKYQPEKAIVIAGRITKPGGKPVENARVTLMSNSNGFFATDTLTGKDGRFAFNGDYIDSVRFTIKAVTKGGDDDVIVALDNNYTPVNLNKNAPDIKVNLDNGLTQYMQNGKKKYDYEIKEHIGGHSILLKAVNVNTIKTSPKQERAFEIKKATEFSSNLNGPGVADQVVTGDDLEGKGCPNLWACLDGMLAGVFFAPNPYMWRAPVNPQTMVRWPMSIILDGIFIDIANAGVINAIPVGDVSSVEVLKSAGTTGVYGSRSGGGVMVITTKHGKGFIPDAKSEISYIRPRGYYVSREFYSPKYNYVKPGPQAPDLRSTIYWNPVLKTGENGKASVEYFNADKPGTYRVTIEGLAYDGKIGRQVYRYKVE